VKTPTAPTIQLDQITRSHICACPQHEKYVIYVVVVSVMDSVSCRKHHSSEHKSICTRSLEPGRPKRLYFVSSGVKHLLQNDDREALKVTMTGLKVFERQELKVGRVLCQQRTVSCPPTLGPPVCVLAGPQAFVRRLVACDCIDTCSSSVSNASLFKL
jgi:hypothetical protein